MAGTIYLTFHDQISTESANRFIGFCTQLIQEYQPDKLYFLLSSGGGDVNSGVTMYNYLRGLPAQIVMHNVGSIDSIANAVFLAGEKRYATPHSAFLFHGILWNFPQPTTLTYSQMQEIVSRFDAAELLFANIIKERTNFSVAEVRELLRQGQSKGPEFALSKEVVHDIREVSVPKESTLFAISSVSLQQ